MNFKDFLIMEVNISDGNYKDKIELDDAVDIFRKHCKDYDIDKPLWRGMRDDFP